MKRIVRGNLFSMRFSVLISNYNNALYLEECVCSILDQTLPAYEVIIVDDGSTDESLNVLQKLFGNEKRIRIISQTNQGQIAALGAAIKDATGDIFCFLDADDTYKPKYLESIAATYTSNPQLDVVFCSFETFGDSPYSAKPSDIVWPQAAHDYDYGYTSILSAFEGRTWIGNITSTVSMKAKLARILGMHELAVAWNYPIEADYALLLGASILGGRKYYLSRPLINYRLQQGNCAWAPTKGQKKKYDYRRRMLHQIALNFFKQRACIKDTTYWMMDDELATVPDPMPSHIAAYKKMRRKTGWSRGIIYPRFAWLRNLERRFRAWRKRDK